jgi:hypothetical protein
MNNTDRMHVLQRSAQLRQEPPQLPLADALASASQLVDYGLQIAALGKLGHNVQCLALHKRRKEANDARMSQTA